MELTIILDYIIISIIASMAINSILRNYAKNYNLLVDLPNRSRKFHKRPTPLTGGIGILIAILVTGKLYIDLNNLSGYVPDFTFQLMLISVPLIGLFLIDDIKGLKPLYRILIQCALAIYMIFSTNVYLESFGNLFGFGEVNLGIFSIPLTIFCVVGIMNAFNMIDGINGLCSGCAMLALLLIGFYSGLIYDSMLVLIIGSIIGFLIFNLRLFGKKRGVFLGDSGSNLIGFWVAWSAIYASQNELYNVEPITMIWFVAIPLLDCIALIFFRLKKGISLASAGRDHIHHKLMKNFSPESTLFIILLITLITGLFGIYIENNSNPLISLLLFITYGSIYFTIANHFDESA
ncbi:MAG: MraY family glycosyltransferase [Gammaproteobacteria bacterium]|tara:strand:- start:1208 stop:2251 length:1044 start_codon:yes stop_codon:yes gene_type:complete